MQKAIGKTIKKQKKTATPKKAQDIDPSKLFADLRAAGNDAVLFKMIPKEDPEDTDTADEEEVNTKDFPFMFQNMYNSRNTTLSSEEFKEKVSTTFENLTISKEQIKYVEQNTRGQSCNPFWFAVRSGRITASQFGKFKPDKTLSLGISDIHAICYKSESNTVSLSANWGIKNESKARNVYKAMMSPLHKDFKVHECGFFISPKHSYLGASPDGLVECACHGSGLLEIKCPFSIRDETPDNAQYLQCGDHGCRLSNSHDYFAQDARSDDGVCERQYCDLVVYTSKGIHIERMNVDEKYCSNIHKNLEMVFKTFILPELMLNAPEIEENATSHHNEICTCKKATFRKIVQCSSPSCTVKYFHYECVQIKRKPAKGWLCTLCRQ